MGGWFFFLNLCCCFLPSPHVSPPTGSLMNSGVPVKHKRGPPWAPAYPVALQTLTSPPLRTGILPMPTATLSLKSPIMTQ